MKKSKKIAILLSAVLITVGVIISFSAFAVMDFNFKKLDTTELVTNTYTVRETFDNIHVEDGEANIRFLPSKDETCTVVCKESASITHNVAVTNGTLTITQTDESKWYEHIGIFFEPMETQIYLPKTEYKKLSVSNIIGNIEVPVDFSFKQAQINNSSGNTVFAADVKNDLSLLSVSGNIKITNIKCKNIDVKNSTGKTVLQNTVATDNIQIKSVTGDVKLQKSDAGNLNIETSTGSVRGSLLTDKIFSANSSTGDVDVPQSGKGGICKVHTSTGDIKLTVE